MWTKVVHPDTDFARIEKKRTRYAGRRCIMYNLREIFFSIGPALKVIFEIGFEPKEEDFYEFAEEHYGKFHREIGDTPEKMYMLLPKDYRHLPAHEVMTVTEAEKNSLLKAAQIIEKYCLESNEKFDTYEDKLRHAAKMLPSVFSEKTKFSR